jgi:hypothetical protein
LLAVAALVSFLLALILHLLAEAGSVSYDCVLFGAVFLAGHFALGPRLPWWRG